MKLWKKVLMCSTVVLAGLTLGACGNKKSNNSATDSKKPITLWVATDYVPWYKTSVKQFEKSIRSIR